jgi:hypothetical protein
MEVFSNPEADYAFNRMFSFEADVRQFTMQRITDPEQGFYEINQLLILLVRSLFSFSKFPAVATQSQMKHILDALTSVFECEDLKSL